MALAQAVASAEEATARAEVIRRYTEEWGVSEATARRHAGVRVRMAARPETSTGVAPELLDQVVALWLASATEKYSTATMPLADVIDMAEVAGILTPGTLSLGQLRRYIEEQRVTLADQRRGTPHIHVRTEHPNHVHLADVTRCRQWYLTGDGRPDVQSYRRGTAEYRNKDLRGTPLYRYVLVDHTSGMLYVQYCTDETVPTLLTFLAGGWFPKRQRHAVGPTGVERWWPAPFAPDDWASWSALPLLRDYPFRGAPRLLVLDRASANQSQFTRELCRRLGIELVLAQAARAKGAVEAMMWVWERKFEARLALQPAPDLPTLNVWALDFLAHWCRKAVHSRHGMTRTQAWSLVTPEQLRELPTWPVFQELARRQPEPRTVKSGEAGHGLLYHEGRAWRVPDASLIGQVVQVSYAVFHPDQLEARTADDRVLLLEEARRDRWGFFENAPVLGQAYARHPDSATQKTEKRLEAVRAALPPLQVFGREGDKRDVPAVLGPRQGVEIRVDVDLGPREIARSEFNRRVIARLARALTEAEGEERNRRLDGRATVPEAEVEDFATWCERQAAAAVSPKVVNLFR